MDFLKT